MAEEKIKVEKAIEEKPIVEIKDKEENSKVRSHIDPENWDAILENGVAYLHSEEHQKARSDFENLISLMKSNPKDLENYKHLEDWKDYECIEQVMSNLYRLIGDSYYHERRYEEALEAYNKAIELNNKNAKAFEYIGDLYLWHEGKYEKARSEYEKAIRILEKENDSTDKSAILSNLYCNIGATYYWKDNPTKKLEAYNKAIELNNKNADAFKERGYIHFIQGNKDKAEKDFERAIDLYPYFEKEIEDYKEDYKTL